MAPLIADRYGLYRQIYAGECALFVGAGFPAAFGLPLPTGTELAKQLVAEIGPKSEPERSVVEQIRSTPHPSLRVIAEMFEFQGISDPGRPHEAGQRERNRVRLLGTIYRRLANRELKAKELRSLSFLWRHEWRAIYTTNYDTVIEQALSFGGKPFVTVTGNDDLMGVDPGTLKLVKLHGSLDEFHRDAATGSRRARVVVSSDDYLHFPTGRDLVIDELGADLAKYPFLFIGYSLRDETFNEIHAGISRLIDLEGKKSFLVARRGNATAASSVFERAARSASNILTIEEDLEAFFADLADTEDKLFRLPGRRYEAMAAWAGATDDLRVAEGEAQRHLYEAKAKLGGMLLSHLERRPGRRSLRKSRIAGQVRSRINPQPLAATTLLEAARLDPDWRREIEAELGEAIVDTTKAAASDRYSGTEEERELVFRSIRETFGLLTGQQRRHVVDAVTRLVWASDDLLTARTALESLAAHFHRYPAQIAAMTRQLLNRADREFLRGAKKGNGWADQKMYWHSSVLLAPLRQELSAAALRHARELVRTPFADPFLRWETTTVRNRLDPDLTPNLARRTRITRAELRGAIDVFRAGKPAVLECYFGRISLAKALRAAERFAGRALGNGELFDLRASLMWLGFVGRHCVENRKDSNAWMKAVRAYVEAVRCGPDLSRAERTMPLLGLASAFEYAVLNGRSPGRKTSTAAVGLLLEVLEDKGVERIRLWDVWMSRMFALLSEAGEAGGRHASSRLKALERAFEERVVGALWTDCDDPWVRQHHVQIGGRFLLPAEPGGFEFRRLRSSLREQIYAVQSDMDQRLSTRWFAQLALERSPL